MRLPLCSRSRPIPNTHHLLQHHALSALEILFSFSAMDVFFLSIAAAVVELHQLAAGMLPPFCQELANNATLGMQRKIVAPGTRVNVVAFACCTARSASGENGELQARLLSIRTYVTPGVRLSRVRVVRRVGLLVHMPSRAFLINILVQVMLVFASSTLRCCVGY